MSKFKRLSKQKLYYLEILGWQRVIDTSPRAYPPGTVNFSIHNLELIPNIKILRKQALKKKALTYEQHQATINYVKNERARNEAVKIIENRRREGKDESLKEFLAFMVEIISSLWESLFEENRKILLEKYKAWEKTNV